MVTVFVFVIEPRVELSEEINLVSLVFPEDTLSECVSVMWLVDLNMYHLICLIQSKGFNCTGVTVILSQTF